jgi:disulfide oxidoreductase YuzD
MTCSVLIVGLPSAATCPPEKTWRSAASFVAQRLHARFGASVAVEYVDLFSPEMGDHPDAEARIATDGLMPPVVVVDGTILYAGGKLNVSAIERAVAAALEGVAVALPAAVAHG